MKTFVKESSKVIPTTPVKAFLSQPYGKNAQEKIYWEAFQTAIERVAEAFDDPPLKIFSAKNEQTALTIKENVKNLIDMCDMTIACLTGSNPNVLWEIGYTEAQHKPVIYLIDEDEHELVESPVLLIEALKCPYNTGILKNLLHNTEFPLEFTIPFKGLLKTAIKFATTKRVDPIALITPNRDLCGMPEIVAGAVRRVYLVTTNLTYFADFDKFTVEHSPKEFAFDIAVKNNIDIRILALDPDSPIVKYRAEQLGLGYNVALFRENLRQSLYRFYQRYKNNNNVSIRVYDDVPLQIALIVDDEVVLSIMARGSQGRNNVHFRMNLNIPGARETFENHFNVLTEVAQRPISAFGWATREVEEGRRK